MAKKSTAKKSKPKTRRVSRTALIEQSLRDAQHVLAGYIESGGKQVTDTIGTLMKIFESPKLGSALKPRRSARRRTAAKRTMARHNAPKSSAASRRAPARKRGR
jgi:hypothetical protein